MDLKPTRRLGLTGLAAATAAACSPLGLFSTLTPKDTANQLVRSEAYGPDPRQKLDVYVPRRPKPPAPILMFFYGGAWDSGRRQDYGWVGRALAAQGFVVVVADYRLLPSVRFPAFLQDGAAATRWAVDNAARIGGDPKRLILAGHSAGAYNAIMLGLNPAYLRAAGVDPQAVKALAGLSGPYDFLPLDGPITQRTFGDVPDLPATQPINFVSASSPPAFLANGAEDTLVGVKNTVNLAAALRKAGVDVESHIYPGVDHPKMVLALSRPFRGAAPVLSQMTAFLHAHAG
jgi:acetyl esterase/lipase